MKKKIVIILILSILLIVNIFMTNCVYGLTDLNGWKPSGFTENSNLNLMFGAVLGIIKNIGIIISVIGLMIIGLKSMFGSIEEKSEYKEKLPTYFIGAVVLIMCTSLPSIIYDFVKS